MSSTSMKIVRSKKTGSENLKLHLFTMRFVRYSCLIISMVSFVLYVVYGVKALLALAFISAILSTVIFKKMRKDKTQS